MKFLIPLLLQAVVLSAFAAGPPLQNFCDTFKCEGCELVWAVTNQAPASIPILKVVPTKFSQNTISNLLQLADLTEKDKKRPVQSGVFTGKGVLSYGNRKQSRSVELVPFEGFMVMINSDVVAQDKTQSEGVPTFKEAFNLAMQLLPTVGISPSGLAPNPNGKVGPVSAGEDAVTYTEKPSGKVVTNLLSRTIALRRTFDGIPSWAGNVTLKFGNHGRVSELDATWRAVEPSKEIPVPSQADFLARVKSGKALVRDDEHRRFKELTITNVRLYYWENFGSEPQSLIFPFAVLEAKTGREPNSTIEIFVPFTDN